MSITGSLVGYENNNDMANSSTTSMVGTGSCLSKKNRSLLNMSNASTKQCISLNSSLSNSVITTASGASVATIRAKQQQSRLKRRRKLHLNSLWSIWYGILATVLQAYLILHGAQRYLGCSLLTWKHGEPLAELSIQIMMCVLAVALLPIFFSCAVFKVGNLANDGFKLASGGIGGNGRCSAEPEDGLEVEAKGGTLRALWTHGGPTSAFLHIAAALCLLLPRLLLEARLIENGNLQRDNIWRTELDFMVTHQDRLVVLSFMTPSPYHNDSNGLMLNGGPTKKNGKSAAPNRIPAGYDAIVNGDAYMDGLDHGDEEEASLLDELLYEKTHLIDRFNDDDEDDDGGDMFEKLESESTVGQGTTTTTLGTPSSTGGTASSSTSTTTTTTSTSTTTTRRQKNARKQGGGRKAGRNRSREDAEPEDSMESALPTRPSRKDRNRNNNPASEDFDERLELQSNSKIDFGRINEFDVAPVFETNRKASASNGATAGGRIDELLPLLKPGRPADGGNKRKFSGTATATTRDSEIHVVKPDKSADALAASASVTPISTDSKIIEIKPSSKNNRKTKRDASDDDNAELDDIDDATKNDTNADDAVRIEAQPLIGAVPVQINVTAAPARLTGLSGLLQRLLRVDSEPDVAAAWGAAPSLEFLNLALAILVWSVRYPSVFWGTSKAFSLVFSVQLIANGLDILLGFAGVSVLYKLQVIGQPLPLHAPALLLNAVVTLSLFLLSVVLTIASSLIIYLYGHGRLAARIRDRRIISCKTGTDTWSYFAHCASLCFVLALAVVKASLMHDLSAAYRGSLDGAVLLAALGTVTHLLLWIVLWLGLTVKRRWHFKLPPLQLPAGVGGGAAANASNAQHLQQQQQQQPLLVSPRIGRLSQGLLQGSLHHGGGGGMMHGGPNGGNVEDIYWPKQPSSPKLKVTFNEIPSTSSDHDLMGEHDGKRNPGRRTSLRVSSPAGPEADDGDYATLRGPGGTMLLLDAEYAHHHQLQLHHQHHQQHANHQQQHQHDHHGDLMADDTSEEGKLLACVRDDSVTYASTRDLEPPTTTTTITSSSASSATSPPPPPQMMHDDDDDVDDDDVGDNNCGRNDSSNDGRENSDAVNCCANRNNSDDDDLPPPPDNFLLDAINSEVSNMISPIAPVNVTVVHANDSNHPAGAGGQTPRCLRRADSGMPATDALLTPRSDTTSTESSSASPPERALSESSSGVHSGEEREEIYIRSRPAKTIVKPPQPAIAEEPFGRSTNMRMSSFNNLAGAGHHPSSATLPLNRATVEHQRMEYSAANHCNTMPLQSQYRTPATFQSGAAISTSVSGASASAGPSPYAAVQRNSLGNSMMQTQHQQQQQQPQPHLPPPPPQQHQHLQQQQHHTTLPSAIRFAHSNNAAGMLPMPSAATANFLRRMPHMKNAESPYGILGLGAGHHTFSKLLQDPLMCPSIPEDRDSANYSMISESDREMFSNSGHGH